MSSSAISIAAWTPSSRISIAKSRKGSSRKRRREPCCDGWFRSRTCRPSTNADFLVEAVPEKLEIKRHVLGEADRMLRDNVIIASNTSSIAMTTLAALTKRPTAS